jgi:hypothetical protein
MLKYGAKPVMTPVDEINFVSVNYFTPGGSKIFNAIPGARYPIPVHGGFTIIAAGNGVYR